MERNTQEFREFFGGLCCVAELCVTVKMIDLSFSRALQLQMLLSAIQHCPAKCSAPAGGAVLFLVEVV